MTDNGPTTDRPGAPNKRVPVRVLVTDDEEMYRKVLDALPPSSRKWIDVTESSTLGNTIAILNNPATPVDVHLLDLNLEGESTGAETWRILQQHVKAPMPPTIIVSGEKADDFRDVLIAEGVVSYLDKGDRRNPLTPRRIYEEITNTVLRVNAGYREVPTPRSDVAIDRLNRARKAGESMPPGEARDEQLEALTGATPVLFQMLDSVRSSVDSVGHEVTKSRRENAETRGMLIGVQSLLETQEPRILNNTQEIDRVQEKLHMTRAEAMQSNHDLREAMARQAGRKDATEEAVATVEKKLPLRKRAWGSLSVGEKITLVTTSVGAALVALWQAAQSLGIIK